MTSERFHLWERRRSADRAVCDRTSRSSQKKRRRVGALVFRIIMHVHFWDSLSPVTTFAAKSFFTLPALSFSRRCDRVLRPAAPVSCYLVNSLVWFWPLPDLCFNDCQFTAAALAFLVWWWFKYVCGDQWKTGRTLQSPSWQNVCWIKHWSHRSSQVHTRLHTLCSSYTYTSKAFPLLDIIRFMHSFYVRRWNVVVLQKIRENLRTRECLDPGSKCCSSVSHITFGPIIIKGSFMKFSLVFSIQRWPFITMYENHAETGSTFMVSSQWNHNLKYIIKHNALIKKRKKHLERTRKLFTEVINQERSRVVFPLAYL